MQSSSSEMSSPQKCKLGTSVTLATLAGLLAASPLGLQAQVPGLVASSQVTIGAGLGAGKTVVDKCGDVFIAQGYNGVVEIQAGTGKQIVVASPGAGLAIDAAKANLYVALGSQLYSSSFSRIPIVNCTLGTPVTVGNNTGVLTHYYYGTASDIALDGAGDLFFTVTSNNPTGTIVEDSASGNPTILQALWPNAVTSLAADAAGDVFFTDGTNNVYEIAATVTAGTVSYPAPAKSILSTLTKAAGVSFDASGNMYVSDSGASVVYKVPFETPAGGTGALNFNDKYVVVAGTVTAAVSVDASNNVYYSGGAGAVAALTGTSIFPKATVGQAGTSSSVQFAFNVPTTVASIKVLSGSSASSAFALSGTGCTAGTSYAAGSTCNVNLLFNPATAGLQTGSLVLADGSGNVIDGFALSGTGLAPSAAIDPGTVSTISSGFKTPQGATLDSAGNLYVVDAGANTLTRFAAGSVTGTTVSTGALTLTSPGGVALDGFGNIFIADTGGNRVIEIPTINGVLTPTKAAVVNVPVKAPAAVAVDGLGGLYIADTGTGRLAYVPSNNGVLNPAALQSVTTGLVAPSAVAVDAGGNVYVSDSANNNVLEFPSPLQSLVGLEVIAGLNAPSALATDASGSVFVVEKSTGSVFKYPNVGGVLGPRSFIDAGITAPYGLAVDGGGNLFVTDSVNGLVEKVARQQVALPFGDYSVGSTSTPLVAAVSNGGNLPIQFPTPSYVASGATASFAVTNDGCAAAGTLAPGASCSLSATFSPAAAGAVSDTLILAGNATYGAPQIALSGTGMRISQTTLTLALTAPASGASLAVGVPVTFTATVGSGAGSASAGGAVKFAVNGYTVGYASVAANAAKLTLPDGLPAGNPVITATYSGDAVNYDGATASITENVTPLGSSVGLVLVVPFNNPNSANDTGSTGPAVGLVATVSFSGPVIPGGTVTFYQGVPGSAAVLGTAPVLQPIGGSFRAAFTTNALRAGTTNVTENNSTFTTYNLFAVYSGDTSLASSTSGLQQVTIVAPPVTQGACAAAKPATCAQNTTGAYYTLSPGSLSVTVVNGIGSANLTVASFGGWSGVLNFTCAGLPAYATCSPYPGAPLINASPAAGPIPQTQVQFFIKTNVTPPGTTFGAMSWWAGGLLGLLMLQGRRRARRFGFGNWYSGVAFALVLACATLGFSGCSTGFGAVPYVTPKGTSTVTVTVQGAQLVPMTTNGSVALNDQTSSTFPITLTVQ